MKPKVEFLTWGTHAGAGNGMLHFLNTHIEGGNVGHAAVRIMLPITEDNTRMLEELCDHEDKKKRIPYKIVKRSTKEAVRDDKGDWVRSQSEAYSDQYYEVYWSWWPGAGKAKKGFTLEGETKRDSIDERDGVHFEVSDGFSELGLEKRMQRGKLSSREITLMPLTTVHAAGLTDKEIELLNIESAIERQNALIKSLSILHKKVRDHGYDFETDVENLSNARELINSLEYDENGRVDLHGIKGKEFIFNILGGHLSPITMSWAEHIKDINDVSKEELLSLVDKIEKESKRKKINSVVGKTERNLLFRLSKEIEGTLGEDYKDFFGVESIDRLESLDEHESKDLLLKCIELNKLISANQEKLKSRKKELEEDLAKSIIDNPRVKLCESLLMNKYMLESILNNLEQMTEDDIEFYTDVFLKNIGYDIKANKIREQLKLEIEKISSALEPIKKLIGTLGVAEAESAVLSKQRRFEARQLAQCKTALRRGVDNELTSVYAEDKHMSSLIMHCSFDLKTKKKKSESIINEIKKIKGLVEKYVDGTKVGDDEIDLLLKILGEQWKEGIVNINSLSTAEVELLRQKIEYILSKQEQEDLKIQERLDKLNKYATQLKVRVHSEVLGEGKTDFNREKVESAIERHTFQVERLDEQVSIRKKDFDKLDVSSQLYDERITFGMSPSCVVTLPVQEELESEVSYSRGMDARAMLKKMREIADSGKPFDLSINNCSVTAGGILEAGAPKDLKPYARRLAFGAIGNPQTVHTGALNISEHLYSKKKLSLNSRISFSRFNPMNWIDKATGKLIHNIIDDNNSKVIKGLSSFGLLLMSGPVIIRELLTAIIKPISTFKKLYSINKYINSVKSKSLIWKGIKLGTYLGIGVIGAIASIPAAITLSMNSFKKKSIIGKEMVSTEIQTADKIAKDKLGEVIEISGLSAVDAIREMEVKFNTNMSCIPVFSPEQQSIINEYMKGLSEKEKKRIQEIFDRVLSRVNVQSHCRVYDEEMMEHKDRPVDERPPEEEQVTILTTSSCKEEDQKYTATTRGFITGKIIKEFPSSEDRRFNDKISIAVDRVKRAVGVESKEFLITEGISDNLDLSEFDHIKFLSIMCEKLKEEGIKVFVDPEIIEKINIHESVNSCPEVQVLRRFLKSEEHTEHSYRASGPEGDPTFRL